MKKTRLLIMMIVVAGLTNIAFAEEQATGKVKYTAGKDVNFEELLIQGQLKRPEISVITGNVKQGADGLLRLRENFLDRVESDAGEGARE